MSLAKPKNIWITSTYALFVYKIVPIPQNTPTVEESAQLQNIKYRELSDIWKNVIIVDCVHTALFSAREQTHCVHVACDSEP